MKTMRYCVVCLFLAIGFFGISENSNSQNKKELRRMQSTQNYFILDSVLKAKRFVFDVDFITDMTAYRNKHINPSINFIEVDGDKGVIQTGNYTGIGGNGVGGYTIEGKILSYNLSQDSKNLSHNLKFSFDSKRGPIFITIDVTSDNHATLLFGWDIWNGHLVTIDNSGIYKGLSY
jgi:hypothetical protein